MLSFHNFMDETYWNKKYDRCEMKHLKSLNRFLLWFELTYTTAESCVCFIPISVPLMREYSNEDTIIFKIKWYELETMRSAEMIGSNGTGNELPYKFFFNVPHLHETPVFQIAFVIQVIKFLTHNVACI